MAHKRTISLPLTVAIICMVIIGSVLTTPPAPQPQAAPLGNETATAYAFVTATAEERARQNATATAAYPFTLTARAGGNSTASSDTPTSTNTHTPTYTNTPTVGTASDTQATDTPTATQTNTAIPTDTPSPAAAPTPEPATATATPTQTTTVITEEQELYDCSPGVPVIIEGTNAPPAVALVLFMGREEKTDRVRRKVPFDEKSYVAIGGGVSDLQGRYSLTLVMGEEAQPQTYTMHIRVRHTMKLVREFQCRVEERVPEWELDEY